MTGTSRGPRPGRRPAPENAGAGWTVFSYLIGGMAVYGGIGWLIGRWAGHTSAFLAGGMIIGLALAVALVIFRYGRS